MKRFLLPVLMVLACWNTAVARNRYVPIQYATIQAAIDACNPGDVVVVSEGTYNDCVHQASPTDTTKCVVVMKTGVTLTGAGGAGGCIIDAGGLGRGIHCSGVTNGVIEGFTVKGAFAATYGAGIYCFNGSSPVIRDCVVRDCLDGGIIIRQNSSPPLTNVRMLNNAAKEGGGLAIDTNCNPVVTSCFILGNQAPSGGGVFVRAGSTPQFRGCLINDNFINLANGVGGGVRILASSPTFTDCMIRNNTSSSSGGGMAMEESGTLISRCQIIGNETTATYGPGGGILVDFNSAVTIEDCLIAGNHVVGIDPGSDGGGIRAFVATSLIIRRCTIASNAADGGLGGGVSAGLCSPVIEKSIIANNGPGRALYCDDVPSGAFTVSCSDLFGNAGGNAICGTDGGNNFSLNPLFCDLPNGHYYLQPASPCMPGQHPNGPAACSGSRIGAYLGGCAPLDVPGVGVGLALQSRPNPFQGSTEIRFELPTAGIVAVAVYDAAGRELRVLSNEAMLAGPHQVSWDGTDASGVIVPSGVYFYRLSVGGRSEGRRVIVSR